MRDDDIVVIPGNKNFLADFLEFPSLFKAESETQLRAFPEIIKMQIGIEVPEKSCIHDRHKILIVRLNVV